MKLTLMTNAFMFEPLDKALEQVARAGYRYVEIMCDRPHMYPGDFDAAAREKVRRRCADLGLEIVALDALHLHYESSGITPPTGVYCQSLFYPNPNANQPLFTCVDPAIRRARIRFVKDVIDMAADMGVPKVETFSGKAVTDPDQALAWAVEGLVECGEHAKKRGVQLVLELSESLVIGTPDEMIDFFADHSDLPFGVCVDVGHLECERLNVNDTIRKLRRITGNFHLNDTKHHKHYHLIPGLGDVNWMSCMRTIRQTGYQGSLCVEIYPYALDALDAVIQSRAFIEACMAQDAWAGREVTGCAIRCPPVRPGKIGPPICS